MKDPNHAKGIMYLILFGSFVPFVVGAMVMVYMLWLAIIMYIVGTVLMGYSLLYGIKNVRCPHCGQLQSLKLWPITTCPYCKKRVDRFF